MTPDARRHWWERTTTHALVLCGLLFAAYVFLVAVPAKGTFAVDAVAYWSVDLARPYDGAVGDLGFFPYAPPIALLLAPLNGLPWLGFLAVWYGLLLGVLALLAWLGRTSILILLALPPVALNLSDGNIHLLIALAIVLGFRYPAAWSFVLLTKVTPGIGLLWFAARKEWRSLAVALGCTALIVGGTLIYLPTQWAEWVAMLATNAGRQPPAPALPIPLWIRLPIAAAIVWWGARRDKHWTVLLGSALAEPALWPASFAILAGWWAVRRIDATKAPADASARRQMPSRQAESGREPVSA